MFSQTVEYALRAMICLASPPLDSPAVSSSVIAGRTAVPPGYLSKILRDLVVAKLVKSFRGPRGGFTLARAPEEITILDVVNAVDPFRRLKAAPAGADDSGMDLLHQRLDHTMTEIQAMLGDATLADVLRAEGELGGNSGERPARQPGAGPDRAA
jgi:Rrf2 family transcriptional regulator, nitric oxide-sensitive transcriptional repressor